MQHPDDVQLSAETINNLDIAHIEHSDGFRSGMRAWNRTVQFGWQILCIGEPKVYKVKWNTQCLFLLSGMAFTQAISLFSHYSFVYFCGNLIFRVYPIDKRPAWFSMLWSFIRMRGFESMACGFLLLNFSDTIRLWLTCASGCT
uniref:Uncharacterized protein n=1 Tax=Ditylenchus dipsaci TaxID=166011 RepID=A0A915D9K4_9BILA